MLSYPVSLFNKNHLYRPEIFSGYLTNLPKQKMDIVKPNNLDKT